MHTREGPETGSGAAGMLATFTVQCLMAVWLQASVTVTV